MFIGHFKEFTLCSLYMNYVSLVDLDHVISLTIVLIQVHCTQITAICMIITDDKIVNVYYRN